MAGRRAQIASLNARSPAPKAVVGVLAIIALSTVAPSPAAHAGTVRIELASETHGHMVEPVWQTVVFDADPGESNRITVTTTGRYEVTVRDEANRLTAPRECGRIDDRTVTCRGGHYEDRAAPRAYEFHDLAQINPGDRHDSAAAAGAIGVSLSGGTGNDRLTGGPGDGQLAGDAGTDTAARRRRRRHAARRRARRRERPRRPRR